MSYGLSRCNQKDKATWQDLLSKNHSTGCEGSDARHDVVEAILGNRLFDVHLGQFVNALVPVNLGFASVRRQLQ